MIVLVTFLLLWQNTITKATYKRKHLTGLMISESWVHHGGAKSEIKEI